MEEYDSQTDDFIGWKSDDGKLEVVGIDSVDRHGVKLYKVVCSECSKDRELFPESYFISRKYHLTSGKKPCGCAKTTRWNKDQYLILARRIGEENGFIVHGFAEAFKGVRTKLKLECKNNHTWFSNYNNISNQRRCPVCSRQNLKVNGNGNGYYRDKRLVRDFMYILNFNNKFIKIGRSFDVDKRITKLKHMSKIKNIKKLYVLTGTHQEIYNLEQELHNELRERGFSYHVDWSTECFDDNSLDFIKYSIQKSGLKTVG